MGTFENIFIASSLSVRAEAETLARVLGLEMMSFDGFDEAYGLRRPAQAAAGFVGFAVHPNIHVVPDPEPDDLQALDGYRIEVDIGYRQDALDIQRREARLVFDQLVWRRPDTAFLLCHELTHIQAAYLPGAGLHDFPPLTSMDPPDMEMWRPWVPNWRMTMDQKIVWEACETLAEWSSSGGELPYTAASFAAWDIRQVEEWLLFAPGGDGYTSGCYLVREKTVHAFQFGPETIEDALKAARRKHKRQNRRWKFIPGSGR